MTPVYKAYDQEALNRQYNNRLHVPDFAVHLGNYELLSRKAEAELVFEKDIAYGDHPRERLDVFPASGKGAPVLLFIHGGYWRAFDKSSFRFIASLFVPHNINVVLINYPLAPSATMSQIVQSCEKALNRIHQLFQTSIFVFGHSAGAHLATLLLTGQTAHKLGGIYGCSGIYNLIPVQRSDINDTLKMDEAEAIKNSPVLKSPLTTIPVVLTVGTAETDEFKAQTAELAACWPRSRMEEIPAANHFSILTHNHTGLLKMIKENC